MLKKVANACHGAFSSAHVKARFAGSASLACAIYSKYLDHAAYVTVTMVVIICSISSHHS